MGAIVAILIPVLQMLITSAPSIAADVQAFGQSLANKGIISPAQLASLAAQENADNAKMNQDIG